VVAPLPLPEEEEEMAEGAELDEALRATDGVDADKVGVEERRVETIEISSSFS
jgi:hypothetical protein